MLAELEGYDWAEAFGYAGEVDTCATRYQSGVNVEAVLGSSVPPTTFTREDVAEIAGLSPGENDGPEWIVYGRLVDGRWFFLAAGCDYTGWDCQASGWAKVAGTKDEIIRLAMTNEYRERLGLGAQSAGAQ